MHSSTTHLLCTALRPPRVKSPSNAISPLCPPPPPRPSLPSNHHTVVHVHDFFLYFPFFCSIPLLSHPAPQPYPTLSACSLSVSLSLFCLLFHKTNSEGEGKLEGKILKEKPFSPGWMTRLECHRARQRVAGLTPGQGTYLGCGFDPRSRHI